MAASITIGTIISAAINAAITAVVSFAITSVFGKKPKAVIDTSPLSTALEAGGPKRVVVGRVGVRAARLIANERRRLELVYDPDAGMSSGAFGFPERQLGVYDKTFHHWVAVISDHPITAFRNVYIDGKKVELNDLGWVVSQPWIYEGHYSINFQFFDGKSNDLSELIDLGLVDPGSVGEGTAIVWARHLVTHKQYFQKLFSGMVPTYTFEVDGAALPDPTDPECDLEDEATWKFRRESILVQAFHQISPLGRNRPIGEIDWDQVAEILPRHAQIVTSAHGEEAPRFCADGLWKTVGETHEAAEERIGQTYGGRPIDMATDLGAGGALLRFSGSGPDGEVVDTVQGSKGDYGPDGVAREDAELLDTRPNGFRFRFHFRDWAWEPYTIDWVDNAALAEDGGQRRYYDASSDMVTGHRQAFFLGYLGYCQARYGEVVGGELALRFLRLQAGDYLAIDEPEFGVDGSERYKVMAVSETDSDYPTVEMMLDDPAWHADPGEREAAPIPLSESSDEAVLTVEAPEVTVTSGGTALIDVSGIVMPGMRFVIEDPDPGMMYRAIVEAEYENSGSTVGLSGTATFSENGVAIVSLGPVPAGSSVGWTVRSQSSSVLVEDATGLHVVNGDVEPPGAPTGLAVASDGPGRVTVTVTAPNATDVVSIVAGYVAQGAPAPDLTTLSSRLSVAALPGQVGTTIQFSGLPTGESDGSHDFYAIATDRAGNPSPLAGPKLIILEDVT